MIFLKAIATLSFIGSVLSGTLTVRQDSQGQSSDPWPLTYIALGDSYAAGIGAGHYFQPTDNEVKRCKRFDQSYPGIAESALTSGDNSRFTFGACSGDVLAGIEGQISKLNGKKAHVITLSISGNDFAFGEVVADCIYNWYPFDGNKDEFCRIALRESADKIADDKIWAKYKDTVNNILRSVAFVDDASGNKWSVLVLTGYAKFFAPTSSNDNCSTSRFPIVQKDGEPKPSPWFNGNILYQSVRDKINAMVADVNSQILSKIASIDPSRIIFVDIDSGFEGHRFCEAFQTPSSDPAGGNDPNVWFTSLATPLLETSFTPDPESVPEQTWANWTQSLEADPGFDAGDADLLPGALQQSSSFHPKPAGNDATAAAVIKAVQDWASANNHTPPPPPPSPQYCFPSAATNIPIQIISIPATNDRTQELVEPNGLIAKIREVLCADQCKIPDGMDPDAGAIAGDDTGRCEINLGVQGGSEAYALRDRSISGGQVQHCWDTLLTLITTCVKNGAFEGWQGGVDPNPAFYQVGYRALNAGSHPTIPEDKVLQPGPMVTALPPSPPSPPPPSPPAICNAWHGPCIYKDCNQQNDICTGGKYQGCTCDPDWTPPSKPQLPPNHDGS